MQHTRSSKLSIADGALHGIDSAADPIHARIPPFKMTIPPESNDGMTELDLK